MNQLIDGISLRMMTAADVGQVPIGCQGEADDVRRRIANLGSAAVLAFDGAQHVGQLQFRRYDPRTRSAEGIWNPLYWGDFGDAAPEMPDQTLSVYCYHVGQLDDTEARDPRYHGRGIGLALLDYLLDWAVESGFAAIVAKGTPGERAVMGFMGGQPAEVYAGRGFEVVTSWVDEQLLAAVKERGLVPAEAGADCARVSCCVRRL